MFIMTLCKNKNIENKQFVMIGQHSSVTVAMHSRVDLFSASNKPVMNFRVWKKRLNKKFSKYLNMVVHSSHRCYD